MSRVTAQLSTLLVVQAVLAAGPALLLGLALRRGPRPIPESLLPEGAVSSAVVLDLVRRRARDAEGTASTLVCLAGNAAGLVVALIVQVMRHHPSTAFAILAVIPLTAPPLLAALRRAAE